MHHCTWPTELRSAASHATTTSRVSPGRKATESQNRLPSFARPRRCFLASPCLHRLEPSFRRRLRARQPLSPPCSPRCQQKGASPSCSPAAARSPSRWQGTRASPPGKATQRRRLLLDEAAHERAILVQGRPLGSRVLLERERDLRPTLRRERGKAERAQRLVEMRGTQHAVIYAPGGSLPL